MYVLGSGITSGVTVSSGGVLRVYSSAAALAVVSAQGADVIELGTV